MAGSDRSSAPIPAFGLLAVVAGKLHSLAALDQGESLGALELHWGEPRSHESVDTLLVTFIRHGRDSFLLRQFWSSERGCTGGFDHEQGSGVEHESALRTHDPRVAHLPPFLYLAFAPILRRVTRVPLGGTEFYRAASTRRFDLSAKQRLIAFRMIHILCLRVRESLLEESQRVSSDVFGRPQVKPTEELIHVACRAELQRLARGRRILLKGRRAERSPREICALATVSQCSRLGALGVHRHTSQSESREVRHVDLVSRKRHRRLQSLFELVRLV